MLLFVIKESSSRGDGTTSWRSLAGGKRGATPVVAEPEGEGGEEEEVLLQAVVVEEPAENQRITAEDALFMRHVSQNAVFSEDVDDGLRGTEDATVAPPERPATGWGVPPGQGPVPLMEVDCEELRSREEAAAKALPVNTPEAAIEAFFQLLGDFAFPEPAVDARVLLEDGASTAATSVTQVRDEASTLPTPESRREGGRGAAGEEAHSLVEGHFETLLQTEEDTTHAVM